MRIKKVLVLILIISLIYCTFTSCSKARTESDSDTSIESVQDESLKETNTEAISVDTGTESLQETTPEKSPEPSESLQETTPEKSPEPSDEYEGTAGASSIYELAGLLEDEFLFTPRQVDCMSTEFMFACLYTVDPVNAADLFEARDTEAIASLLNERLFQITGCHSMQYHVSEYQENILTDEIRQQVQDWFMASYSQVAAQYGEYYAQKVSEENEGREQMITLVYTATDEDGNEVTLPEDWSEGLIFSVVNGRYYWNDFSLFQAITE